MIICNNIVKKYGDRTVLSIEKLEIKKGERLCLLGANGSGKSTFLKILAGCIPFSGDVIKNGKVLYMPQKNIPFDMSVLSNVTFALEGKRKDKEERAMAALEKTGLSQLYKKNALSLSGGESARLSLARILVKDCDILLLDEPFAAVDIEGTEIIENAVREYICEKERTLVFSTHSPIQASRLGKTVMMLEKGSLVECTSVEEFIKSPKTEFGRKFVDMWRI